MASSQAKACQSEHEKWPRGILTMDHPDFFLLDEGGKQCGWLDQASSQEDGSGIRILWIIS